MRAILAAIMVALLIVPSYSQDMFGSGGGKRRHGGGQNENAEAQQQKKKKAADLEKAAKAAVDRLPDQKYDPWRNAR
jgi:hypothetical protein